MPKFELSDADFELFKEECRAAMSALNLDNAGFRVDFGFSGEDFASNDEAACGVDLTHRRVFIRLNRTWEEEVTSGRIRYCAIHEVLHMFLEPLGSLAKCRIASRDELDAGAHEVLNRLHHLLVRHSIL